MSRSEVHEFAYPHGLGVHSSRHNEDREYCQRQGLASYGAQERRPHAKVSEYSAYSPRAVQERESNNFLFGDVAQGPNRHNLSASNIAVPYPAFNLYLHRPTSPPHPHISSAPPYSSSTLESQIFRQTHHPVSSSLPQLPATNNISRSTLWWGDLEPWMDEEYAKQVCSLMGWDPVNIKVPHPTLDPSTGQQANNPGYAFLTFPTPAHAASILAQINNGGKAPTMPNSSKPFVLNWASSMASASPTSATFPPSAATYTNGGQQYPKEYSIFVGDLAPETSNSDLVAVFRNPVLGLRNDREPKFIRPFVSCKSAKIMLDPVTGVSRGYGFVRFTDEADQQRALIEMHGLYCLSRPMRISPATAKFKPPQTASAADLNQIQFQPSGNANNVEHSQTLTIALPLQGSNQAKSVSTPIAATPSNGSISSNGGTVSSSNSSLGGSGSLSSLSSGFGSSSSQATSVYGSLSSEDLLNLPNSVLAQIAQQYASGVSSPIKLPNGTSILSQGQDGQTRLVSNNSEDGLPRYLLSEESWKHHSQARAILGNLIGPNGEQLTSTDPYNTTVFVGGLSPLISEDTLRTFFAPFGEIHYVKVPVGKHCGFVQFVRKADAERAIEKMQGFPVGGSRIRLSWGRSQYKAAQAAAQAAQAAALGQQYAAPVTPTATTTITREQARDLVQHFALQQTRLDNPTLTAPELHRDENFAPAGRPDGSAGALHADQHSRAVFSKTDSSSGLDSFSLGYLPRPEVQRSQSNFSPFSPDPNAIRHESDRTESVPPSFKGFMPTFFRPAGQTQDTGTANTSDNTPSLVRAPSSRYGFVESTDPPALLNRRPEAPISRPSSGPSDVNGGREFDAMHDLNGTLASLDLDRPWMNPDTPGLNNTRILRTGGPASPA